MSITQPTGTQGRFKTINVRRLLLSIQRTLFRNWVDSLITALFLISLFFIIPPIISWAFFDCNTSAAGIRECRDSGGACWAFIIQKARLMVFGLYSGEEWRPTLAMFILLSLIVAITKNWVRGRKLLTVVVIVSLVLISVLMYGGVFGLPVATTRTWGGLPLTLGLATVSLVLGFPIGILLALGRRSELPAIRILCITYIEVVRGVPLITVLFMASVMLPLFIPGGENIDNVLRAQIGLIGFAAAYLAEVVRGGLQAIPQGQYEAADALGLSYWEKMLKVVLPQALRISIPPIVNTFIGIFKDTTLIIIVGLFDLLGATKSAMIDGKWLGILIEPYLFLCVIYFVFCFSMSKYSQHLEKNLGQERSNSWGDER